MELHWGVKQSFRDYLRMLPDGTEVVEDGARAEDGVFQFPSDDDSMQFHGSVIISGHGGMMLVRVREPRIEQEGDETLLTIMHPAYKEPTAERKRVARLSPLPSEGLERRYAVHLLLEGTALFDEYYLAGTELDELVIR